MDCCIAGWKNCACASLAMYRLAFVVGDVLVCTGDVVAWDCLLFRACDLVCGWTGLLLFWRGLVEVNLVGLRSLFF